MHGRLLGAGRRAVHAYVAGQICRLVSRMTAFVGGDETSRARLGRLSYIAYLARLFGALRFWRSLRVGRSQYLRRTDVRFFLRQPLVEGLCFPSLGRRHSVTFGGRMALGRADAGVERIALQVIGFQSVAGLEDALVLGDVLPLRLLLGDLLCPGEFLRSSHLIIRHGDQVTWPGEITRPWRPRYEPIVAAVFSTGPRHPVTIGPGKNR